MPKANATTNLEQSSLGAGHYGYSHARVDDLGSSEYTLCTIVCDSSGSVSYFKPELEACIKEVIKACQHSPRADSLMVRMVQFSDTVQEVHGFKPLNTCNQDDYNGVLTLGGQTALFDAAANAIRATNDYGKKLSQSDFMANALCVVITDGDDNASKYSVDEVKKSLQEAVRMEELESMRSILVAVNVNEPHMANCLRNFNTEAGFNQYIELDNANSATLAKLAEFVSKSINAQSQALGTGGPSQGVSF